MGLSHHEGAVHHLAFFVGGTQISHCPKRYLGRVTKAMQLVLDRATTVGWPKASGNVQAFQLA